MIARPDRPLIPTPADLHLNRPDRSGISLFGGWGININGNRLG